MWGGGGFWRGTYILTGRGSGQNTGLGEAVTCFKRELSFRSKILFQEKG